MKRILTILILVVSSAAVAISAALLLSSNSYKDPIPDVTVRTQKGDDWPSGTTGVNISRPSTRAEPTEYVGGVFVEVVRLQGPDNLMITLTADGVLQRLDGSYLQVRRSGRAELDRTLAGKILEKAANLGPGRDSGAIPVEGDLYLVVVPGERPVSAVDARATPELQDFIAMVLKTAAVVSMSPTEQRFIRAEPVDADRAGKLRGLGKDVLPVSQMELATDTVSNACSWTHRPVAVNDAVYSFLENRFGGREGFVADRFGNWFQISLWSPRSP